MKETRYTKKQSDESAREQKVAIKKFRGKRKKKKKI